VHHFTPQTKQVELQWKNAIPLTAKKFKVCQCAGKVYTSTLSNKECDHFVLFKTQLRVQPAMPMPTLQQCLYFVHLTFKIKDTHSSKLTVPHI